MALRFFTIYLFVSSPLLFEPCRCLETLKCKESWLNYSGACYLFEDGFADYRGAKMSCLKYFSSLLQLENEGERQWVASELMKEKEVMSRWIDQSSYKDQGYKVPFVDEPDNVQGKEKCVVLNQSGFFRDEVCSKLAGLLCKTTKYNGNCQIPTNTIVTENSDHCFFSLPGIANWTQGQTNCREHGGDLLSIGSLDELNLIRVLFQRNIIYRDWWTGLYYDDQTKRYKFTDGTPYSQDVVQWLTKEAVGDVIGTGCGALVSSGKLSEYNCESLIRYICKYPLVAYQETECPDNWHLAGSSCYYFSEHHEVNWTQAESECKSMDAHLLKADNQDEKNWLDTTDVLFRRMHWVGLNARSKNGVYVWDDGTEYNKRYIEWKDVRFVYSKVHCGIYDGMLGIYAALPCWLSLDIFACEYKIAHGSQTSCAEGWLSNGHNKCYYFSLVHTGITWYDNVEQCKKKSSELGVKVNLITVENSMEENFIDRSIRDIDNYKSKLMWIGLNDLANEHRWVWEADPRLPINVPFEPRSIFEPGSVSGGCAVVGDHGVYMKNNCSKQYPYICEKEVTGQYSKGDAIAMMAMIPFAASFVVAVHFVIICIKYDI